VDPGPDPHGSASFWEPGSASASNKNPDPDPHQIKIRIRIRNKVMIRIRIGINVMRIRNTALDYLQTEIESLIRPENNTKEATGNNGGYAANNQHIFTY
jgi:hypothetical protein